MKHDNDFNEESGSEDLVDEQAAAWFVRLRAENVADEEKAVFARWLAHDPAHRQAYADICMLWGDAALKRALSEAETKPPEISCLKKEARPRQRLLLAMAACLALAFVFRVELTVLLQADYATKVGEQKTVRLEDGSVVTLNTDSALAVTMQGGQRTIELLKGEAFFDVQPDARRPFVVHGDHSITRVLGTRFFVHEKGHSDEVKVLSGRVEVTDGQRWRQSVVLHDGDAVSVDRDGHSATGRLDTKLTTSWLNGYLVFEDIALGDVIEQVQRYRNGVVIFKDNSLRQLKINGRINLRDPAHILETLEKSLSVRITHLSDWLVIIG
ncbi:FecR family protein [Methylobacter sp. Wu1]|uniref:FecR family protein n=1 Tax=Methylobacter sp. Wu1 TaxID=3119359 RepID=UPI002F92DD3C